MSQNACKRAFVIGVLAVCTLIAAPLSAQAPVPYASSCRLNISDLLNTCHFATVPMGKRLIIQEFDISGYVSTGIRPQEVFINNTLSTTAYFTYTYLTTDNGYDYLATHQPTTVYVPGGNTPTCNVEVPAFSGGGEFACDINGILENAR